MSDARKESENWQTLARYWRRHPFHDTPIESVWAGGNGRVVIRLRNGYTLVITNTSKLKRCELPAVWLYESLTSTPGGFVLDVETDTGHLVLTGTDVRLLSIGDTTDCRILIPPLDE